MPVSTLAVVPEPDATPFVRLLTRTIRSSLRQQPDPLPASSIRGVVVIKSASDAQAATLESTGDLLRIVSGVSADALVVLTVDLERRLEVVEASTEGCDELLATITALIRPSLPQWAEAARDFWSVAGADPGMPSLLVIQNDDDEGDVLELGAGLPRYLVQGSPDALAGLFTGADSFLDEVYAGNLKVRGTLPQLSVMAGASFKVRFHV